MLEEIAVSHLEMGQDGNHRPLKYSNWSSFAWSSAIGENECPTVPT
jgi:hypothetical protein